MRKLFLSFVLLTTVVAINAQSFIENNFKSILDEEKLIRVQVGGKAFNMLYTLGKNNVDADVKKVSEIVSKIKSFDLIALEKTGDSKNLFKTAMANATNFEELIRVKADKANVNIRVKEKNNVVTEIIGIVDADSTFVVFNLVGEIDINDIGEIANKVSESNMSKAFKNKNLDLGDLKVYPNPATKGQNITVEVPNAVVGGKAFIYDSTGKKVKEISLTENNFELSTSDLSNANYVIKFEKGDTSITRKLIITE
jgi:hypothetical protein